MSVVIIGDRKTGKTSMVRALAEYGNHVKIADAQELVRDLYNPDSKEIAGTQEVEERGLVIDIDMPATGVRQLNLQWIDTPGEFWSSVQHRADYAAVWQSLETKLTSSKAVVLLLPPHQSLVRQVLIDAAPSYLKPLGGLPTSEQWVNRLTAWLNYLEKRCGRAKHILIGIHKADLICDVQAEGDRWKYRPDRGGAAPWFEYNDYVIKTYFGAAIKEIRRYKGGEIGSRTSFFITTTENQDLLELPWLYLGPYIAYM